MLILAMSQNLFVGAYNLSVLSTTTRAASRLSPKLMSPGLARSKSWRIALFWMPRKRAAGWKAVMARQCKRIGLNVKRVIISLRPIERGFTRIKRIHADRKAENPRESAASAPSAFYCSFRLATIYSNCELQVCYDNVATHRPRRAQCNFLLQNWAKWFITNLRNVLIGMILDNTRNPRIIKNRS